MRRLTILATVLVLFSSTGLAELYKQVDENGNVSYTDKPGKGQPVKTPGLTTYAPPATHASKPEKSAETAKPAEEKSTTYSRLAITSPTPAETLRGGVNVKLAMTPALNTKAGHNIAVYLDGKKTSEGQSTEISLGAVVRGEHTVYAQITDKSGKVLKKTGSTKFFLQRPTEGGGGE